MIRSAAWQIALTSCLLGLTMSVSAAETVGPATSVAAPAPTFTWSGLRLGLNAGGTWGEYTFNVFAPAPNLAGTIAPASNKTSFLAGGQLGYDFQIGRFIVGVEADAVGKTLNVTNDLTNLVPAGTLAASAARTRVEGSVRARGGVALDRVLVYATGGWAVADTLMTGCTTQLCNASLDQALNGWTAGAGIDFAVTNNISVGVEYRYSDFGKVNFDFGTVNGVPITADASLKEHQATIRLNYRFLSMYGQ